MFQRIAFGVISILMVLCAECLANPLHPTQYIDSSHIVVGENYSMDISSITTHEVVNEKGVKGIEYKAVCYSDTEVQLVTLREFNDGYIDYGEFLVQPYGTNDTPVRTTLVHAVGNPMLVDIYHAFHDFT